MSPVTHLLLGWLVANAVQLERRERAVVVLASIAADADGLGLVVELATAHTAHPLPWFSQYHHTVGHNLGAALVVTGLCWAVSRRGTLAALGCLAFHLHLLADLVGSRGPDGDPWAIPYLLPFSGSWQLSWQGQWALNAWPNLAITGAAILMTLGLAWHRGYSPLEMVSESGDRVLVATLRRRFPAGPRHC